MEMMMRSEKRDLNIGKKNCSHKILLIENSFIIKADGILNNFLFLDPVPRLRGSYLSGEFFFLL